MLIINIYKLTKSNKWKKTYDIQTFSLSLLLTPLCADVYAAAVAADNDESELGHSCAWSDEAFWNLLLLSQIHHVLSSCCSWALCHWPVKRLLPISKWIFNSSLLHLQSSSIIILSPWNLRFLYNWLSAKND